MANTAAKTVEPAAPVVVKHPTLDVSETVPAADVDAWVESGWLAPKSSTKDD